MKHALKHIALAAAPLAFAAAASWAAGQVQENAGAGGAERIEDAVRQAAVACYSTEGMYPDSVGYLEEHYGLRLDPAYRVDYSVFGSNVPPEITAVRLDGGKR